MTDNATRNRDRLVAAFEDKLKHDQRRQRRRDVRAMVILVGLGITFIAIALVGLGSIREEQREAEAHRDTARDEATRLEGTIIEQGAQLDKLEQTRDAVEDEVASLKTQQTQLIADLKTKELELQRLEADGKTQKALLAETSRTTRDVTSLVSEVLKGGGTGDFKDATTLAKRLHGRYSSGALRGVFDAWAERPRQPVRLGLFIGASLANLREAIPEDETRFSTFRTMKGNTVSHWTCVRPLDSTTLSVLELEFKDGRVSSARAYQDYSLTWHPDPSDWDKLVRLFLRTEERLRFLEPSASRWSPGRPVPVLSLMIGKPAKRISGPQVTIRPRSWLELEASDPDLIRGYEERNPGTDLVLDILRNATTFDPAALINRSGNVDGISPGLHRHAEAVLAAAVSRDRDQRRSLAAQESEPLAWGQLAITALSQDVQLHWTRVGDDRRDPVLLMTGRLAKGMRTTARIAFSRSTAGSESPWIVDRIRAGLSKDGARAAGQPWQPTAGTMQIGRQFTAQSSGRPPTRGTVTALLRVRDGGGERIWALTAFSAVVDISRERWRMPSGRVTLRLRGDKESLAGPLKAPRQSPPRNLQDGVAIRLDDDSVPAAPAWPRGFLGLTDIEWVRARTRGFLLVEGGQVPIRIERRHTSKRVQTGIGFLEYRDTWEYVALGRMSAAGQQGAPVFVLIGNRPALLGWHVAADGKSGFAQDAKSFLKRTFKEPPKGYDDLLWRGTGERPDTAGEVVSRIIGKTFGRSVSSATHLRKDLEADDLEILSLMLDIEDAFKISIPASHALKMASVGDLVRYVLRARDG